MATNKLYDVVPLNDPKKKKLDVGQLYLTPKKRVLLYDGNKLRQVETPPVFYVRIGDQVVKISPEKHKLVIPKGRFYIFPSRQWENSVRGVWFKPCEIPLFVRNFRKDPYDTKKDFQLLEIPGGKADDGKVSQNKKTGLTISSVPFTKRGIQIFDHTKYLTFTRRTFTVPKEDLELFLEAKIAFQSTGLVEDGDLAPGIKKYADGIQNIKDEPRLSAGALNFVDLTSGMVFDFILSDSTIYALYEHLPFNQKSSVFTFAKAVAARPNDRDQPIKLRIGVNGFRREVTWYIEGNPVFKVQNPGLPLVDRGLYLLNGDSTPSNEIEVKSLSAGFGTFTLLDFFPFDQSYEQTGQSTTTNLDKVRPLADLGSPYFQKMPDQLGNPVPQTEFVYTGEQEQDGQGAILKVLEIAVGISKCHNHRGHLKKLPCESTRKLDQELQGIF